MRYENLTDDDLLAYIKERYVSRVVDMRVSGERRFTGISADTGERIVINAYPVGTNNAGEYRNWLAMPRPAWGRVFGPKPQGWRHFILMVGLQPDGKSIWWSILYDEEKVARLGLEPEYIRRGYGRLRADQVKSTIAAGPFEEMQTTLPWEDQRVDCYHDRVQPVTDGYACSNCGMPFVPIDVTA